MFASIDTRYRSSKTFWKWIATYGIKLQCMKDVWFEDVSDETDCSKVIEFQLVRLKKVHLVARFVNKSIHLKIL